MDKLVKTVRYLLLKTLRKHYVNRFVVLALDTLFSLIAMGASYGAVVYVFRTEAHCTPVLFPLIVLCLVTSVLVSLGLHIYQHVVRFTSVEALWRIILASIVESGVLFLLVSTGFHFTYFTVSQCLAFTFFFFCLSNFLRTAFRITITLVFGWLDLAGSNRTFDNLMVFGTEYASIALEMRMRGSRHFNVVGFISKQNESSLRLATLPVLNVMNEEALRHFILKNHVKGVLFTSRVILRENDLVLRKLLEKMEVKAMLAPMMVDHSMEHISHRQIREVRIEDLLGRDEITVDMNEIIANFNGKVVLVTGAAGSIGSELCRQLASFGIRKLILFDNAETPTHLLRLELERSFPELDFKPIVGDVRDRMRLEKVFVKYRPQVVFHASAYKHVPLMEENPCEALMVNVMGTHFVADLCVKYEVDRMVMISTDKAVNPTNVMGASKRLAEIYVQSLGLAEKAGSVKGKTKFVTTRFGNVLGSNGSVIPYFRQQIQQGGPVTVTHKDIVRFFMTIPEACRLVMEAATISADNEIFVFDMGEPVKILDMAERMIVLAGLVPYEDIDIKITGLRPGEKLYEEVLSNEENTKPTRHRKIRQAAVRAYDYQTVLPQIEALVDLAHQVKVDEAVSLMKEIVPEYKSMNSVFEKLDK